MPEDMLSVGSDTLTELLQKASHETQLPELVAVLRDNKPYVPAL